MRTGVRRFFDRLDSLADAVSRLGILLSGGCIALVTLMVFCNVLLRACFGLNLPFTEEYASLAMLPMAYLGLGYTLRQGRHIASGVVVSRVSRTAKYLMLLTAAIFGLLTLCFFLERGWDLLSYNWTRGITTNGPMRTPLWLPSAAVFAGLALFTVDTAFWILHLALRLCGRPGFRFSD